ncbi:MAG: hypothetical protein J7494_10670 [Sphingobium sp.]|nr:hypothetical protein [Sphingobium sp.]
MTEETFDTIAVEEATAQPVLDAQEERLALAIPAGLVAALVGAALWALFVYITEYQMGIVVILIGAMIGYVIRTVGRGTRPVFGVLGAVCAALAWAMGTVLCDVAFLAQEAGRPFLEVLDLLGASETISLALRAADVMDFIFFAIAVWEGYKFSIRKA